ncbi:MAG TPA: isoleucine--tRNA ligase [Candidatus Saccharibacteria bacterium]|nr:isoleucine--tRNA ligase [Candidatus Saccharibacteria bacterium]
MKFKHGTRRRALEYEKDWAERWKENKTFEKSVENRPADNAYVFYDGPPFITGVPHHGTLLSSIVKDAVPRYWTMKGKRVERVWGWDTHGLPAENFVEKQLGITDRRQIVTTVDVEAPLDKDGNPLETISLETYITKARESMVANAATWENVVDRVGRWVDFNGAYKTMDKTFMESVWWAFKQLYDAGKIYEGEKVLMFDTKFATPVSKNEVTMDNDAYQTVTDPSLYAKFKLVGGDAFILAWTTTPWTLPANLMLAVNPEMVYCEVSVDGERLIVAEEALERVLKDEKNKPLEHEVIRKFPGSELAGRAYEPLDTGSTWPESDAVHKIYAADFVSSESGTGIVHIAPAYGEDDFELAKANGVGAFHVIDDNGYYIDTNYKGLEVWDNNKRIAKDLMERGIGWKIEYIRHEYPFNPRSKQRIMYRAIPSWFFDVQGQKPLMLEQNENINWFPPHLKHGRFAKNIEQAPDWNLSRDRFWATAMPVWKGDKGTVKVVGSYTELKELSGVELEDYHRPWVDDISFEIDGEKFTRIDKVLDCWFESGSMPFAQLHYPFENQEKFEKNYPADFIVEYVGQVRAWFYYVHVVNTALAEVGAFGEDSEKPEKNAFKNVITTGVVAGNDGRKMSKSLGNFTDPNELMDKFSADSLRFLLLSSPLLKGEDFALHDKDVGDIARKLSMVWNMYDFFTMYAEVDGWEYDASHNSVLNPDDVTNPMDKWIISRVHQLNKQITEDMDAYNIPDAMADILPLLDDASNWYVRRSRRRFWKSDDDGDKNEAYRTLHYVLLKLSVLLAPFTPFLAEELYQNLSGGNESVHLLDWPTNYSVDNDELKKMFIIRDAVNSSLSKRAGLGIKIRQPLQNLKLTLEGTFANLDFNDYYVDILKEEVNVKSVEIVKSKAVLTGVDGLATTELDSVITPELKLEGLMREVIRHVQAARKNAGLNVDDRINLHLMTDGVELAKAIATHRDEIYAETLAVGEEVSTTDATVVKIEGVELAISLEKA